MFLKSGGDALAIFGSFGTCSRKSASSERCIDESV
jgi:hypothetical protein